MGKIIRNFSFIMFVNLIVFLSVGYILDLILETKAKYKIIFLVLSIFSLVFISRKYFKKTLSNLAEIKNIDNNKK